MEQTFFVLEIIGTCAFAYSGAAAAMKKHLDIFGVLFCSMLTALGGGVLRDVLLGNLPPVIFSDYSYLCFAAGSSVAAFIAAKIMKEQYEKNIVAIDRINNIFDAVGLGVFTIAGINTAFSAGFGDNAFFSVFLGMTTGCCGGILRDISIREVPLVFSKRVYAAASVLGGCLYYFLYRNIGANEIIAAVCSVAAIFILRILASVFRWDLPKAY